MAIGGTALFSLGAMSLQAFQATADASPAKANVTKAATTPVRLPVQDLKIMNYYPSSNGWELMWTNYSHATTVSDFQAIASLGANTVRVIVQPAAVGGPTVNPAQLADFDDMINVAASEGLSVQLTLFDMWHDYTDITDSETWLKSLLAGQSGNPTIALVELQNEMPLSSSSITWADTMLPMLQTLLPGVPRTISAPGSAGLAGITTLLSDIPASDLDVVDVHYYGDPSLAYSELSSVMADAGGRPVIVGETGLSTYGTVAGEQAQARYYALMGQTTEALGLPPAAPWMLNDVTNAVGATINTDSEYFGLRTASGTWKPAAAVVQAIYAGQAPPAWAFDGNMQYEANDLEPVLGSWTATDTTAGMPQVTQGIALNGGTQSVCYSGTGGSSSAQPSIEQAFPVLTSGETITVSAYVKRVNGAGQERIALANFDSNDSYLGQTQSSLASGSGTWQLLQTSEVVPAGTASVQVTLKAAYETGQACWDDVTVTT